MEPFVLQPDLDHPYLTRQLIAYIGNKRSLQGFLAGIFRSLVPEPRRGRAAFLDPFAGSGAVSRLARYLGFRVMAGDWEFYAYVLNFAHLCVGRRESEGLFRDAGGLAPMLEELNALPDPAPEDQYVARHYAPSDTATADYRVERLFYTRENALRIDAVRARIEALYPGFDLERPRLKEKLLLLAALLYPCATHTNTSGVFKAFHKGFGGHGRDALRRIMAPIRLVPPELLDGPEAEAACLDAAEFARRRPAELCYLDPPYNQHQYGSNYHLLNTIARWDRLPVDDGIGPDGRLRHKAGIPRDWVRTRSPYCSRSRAPAAFRELLEAIDARWIVVSYNSGGTIALEELVELLSGKGRVSLLSSDYVSYRGGRQSIARQTHTQELALVLERGAGAGVTDRGAFRRTLAVNRLRLLLKGTFHPRRIEAAFPGGPDGILVELAGQTSLLPMEGHYRFLPAAGAALEAAAGGARPGAVEELAELAAALERCRFADLQEETEALISLLGRLGEATSQAPGGSAAIQRRILQLLRKYAHRKYRERFEATVGRLRELLVRHGSARGGREGDWEILARGLPAVEALARARLDG